MTYSLAWATKNEIFMAADTAITHEGDIEKLYSPETAFGQKNFLANDKSRSVEESVVKFFLKNDIGLIFAGQYSLAILIAKTFYEKIENGLSPIEALTESLFDNTGDLNKEGIQIAIGYFDNKPRLVTYNEKPGSGIEKDKKLVQLGNPLNIHKNLSADWIDSVVRGKYNNPKTELAALLGVFQSYNLFSSQMERGIGGTFYGLFIDKDGGQWQPDILFVEHRGKNPKLVITCFRQDCLVISSPTIGRSKCLITYIPPMSLGVIRSKIQKAFQKVERLKNKCEFEYIVIIDREKVNITVVEMLRHKKHDLLWINSFKQENGKTGFTTHLFPKMRTLINRDEPGLVVVHYWAPKIKKIPEDKLIKTIIEHKRDY